VICGQFGPRRNKTAHLVQVSVGLWIDHMVAFLNFFEEGSGLYLLFGSLEKVFLLVRHHSDLPGTRDKRRLA